MAKYEISVGGESYEIEAPNESALHQAVAKITAHAAASQGVQKAIEGAAQRNPDPETMPRAQKNEMLAQNMDQIDPRLSSAYRVNDVAAGMALPAAVAGAGIAAAAPTAGAVLANPMVGGAMGAVEGYHRGGLPGAAVGAAAGYAGGGLAGALGEKLKLLKFVARLGGAKGAAAAEELATLAAKAAPAAASAAPAAEAAPMAVRAAAVGLPEAQAAKTFAPGAESMKDIAAKVISWRQNSGLSKGQIAAALQEHYKIPLSIGAKIANQVISSLE